MTREEAAEIVMLGQYKDCEVCSGAGRIYTQRQVLMGCEACDGLGLRIRERWFEAMCVAGLIKDYDD